MSELDHTMTTTTTPGVEASTLADALAERRVTAFLAALREGQACLHPTDTLPGLTFDPHSAMGAAAVRTIKQRDEGKPFLALVPDLRTAMHYWKPLPDAWEIALMRLLPGPLSVVWQASKQAPRILVSPGGEIGLRVPALPESAAWLRDVMHACGHPLPTTSVNRSGDPACTTWRAAAALLEGCTDAHVPDWSAGHAADFAGRASTVVRILPDGGYEILRDGAMPRELITAALGSLHS